MYVRRDHTIAALLLSVVVSSTHSARTARAEQTDARFQELSGLLLQKMAEYRVPGVAFGVTKNGETLTRGFGVTNVEHPEPTTARTIFPIASISKTVTATAIMKLVERGAIDVHGRVTAHVSALSNQPSGADYTGTCLRPPLPPGRVRAEGDALLVTSGHDDSTERIIFYGTDLAYSVTSGTPYEFIRRADGNVAWIRANGRVAKKGGPD